MLDYTKVAYEKVSRDFKKGMFYFNLFSPIIYILYLVATLLTKREFFAINLILLIITTAYLVFFVCATWMDAKKEIRNRVKKIYTCSKFILKFLILGILVYGIVLERGNPSALTILLTAISCITWVLGVVLEFVKMIASRWGILLFQGIKLDIEPVMNIVNKLEGKLPEQPTSAELKAQEYLKEQVQLKKEQALAAKQAVKQAKKDLAIAQKEAKKQAALAAKQERQAQKSQKQAKPQKEKKQPKETE